MTDEANEERLRDRQDGRVYPVGRALRDVFDADNHETLDGDVTGLMIDLSRVPFGAEAPPSPAIEQRPSESAIRPSILARLGELFSRR